MFVWSGFGGRYQSSYVATSVGTASVTLYDSSIPMNLAANPYSITVQPKAALVIPPQATSATLYLRWSASSAMTLMSLPVLQYNLLISDEPLFAALTAARYMVAPPTAALAIVLPVATKVYVKVQVKVIDPFSNAPYMMDMTSSEYTYALNYFV